MGAPLVWLPCALLIYPYRFFFFLVILFLFGTIWHFRCVLYLHRTHPLISHFCKESWFLLVGKGEIWVLGVVIASGVTLLLGLVLSKAREYMHEYTHACNCKYIHSCICACINVLVHILPIINSWHIFSLHPSPQGLLFLPSFHYLYSLFGVDIRDSQQP